MVVDFGSGAGIDVFLTANIVKENGKVIGIDMTDNMLQKAMDNVKRCGYKNVEFRQGDIENKVPVEDNIVRCSYKQLCHQSYFEQDKYIQRNLPNFKASSWQNGYFR